MKQFCLFQFYIVESLKRSLCFKIKRCVFSNICRYMWISPVFLENLRILEFSIHFIVKLNKSAGKLLVDS